MICGWILFVLLIFLVILEIGGLGMILVKICILLDVFNCLIKFWSFFLLVKKWL